MHHHFGVTATDEGPLSNVSALFSAVFVVKLLKTEQCAHLQPTNDHIRSLQGLDKAVTGLAVWRVRKVRLDPEDAYCPVNDDYVIKIPKAKAPDGLEVGDQVRLSNGLPARVTVIGADDVTLESKP